MKSRFVAFHFALVQDVSVLRPLIRLAASMPALDLHLLVCQKFVGRDSGGRWQAGIERLGSEIGVTPFQYESVFDCLRYLGPNDGIIVAGSESDVPAHRDTHELFRSMPGRIRTVTLQHGLECVGFLHNSRHDATAGRNVRFAADIAVTWFHALRCRSVSASERSKLYVAGPPALIEPPRRTAEAAGDRPGMICENLHSVRFANGRLREDFLRSFVNFAQRLEMVGQSLELRPHPAGQFSQRRPMKLPANVSVSQQPLYELDLGKFAYVVSAPSTVLFDAALAGIPAATWVDPDGGVDASNFEGLAQVASVEDWWRFNWAARWERSALVKLQDRFLDDLGMPGNVPARYAALLSLA